ncbi:hypothetical protein SEA_JORDAN_67 [Arthrobacter phage Jordan]|nr:hypothetical protein SEA_JORDAN_67 [Arthrobacter phage Jordan]
MTTWYEIEELDEQGRWQKTLTTRDGSKALSKSMQLALTSTTMRQTTFYTEHDADRVTDAQLEGQKELGRIVGDLAGQASTCWENLDAAGVYDSTRAKEIVEEALVEMSALGIVPSKPAEQAKSEPAVKQPPVNVPGIGRIVHYFQGSTNKVLPAIIKGIGPIDESGGSRVKLEVFWDGREDPLPADGYRPFSREYASGCWSWPPRA